MGGRAAGAIGGVIDDAEPREDGSRTLVRGRLIHFLRRDPDGRWGITLLMNSHSHAMEPMK